MATQIVNIPESSRPAGQSTTSAVNVPTTITHIEIRLVAAAWATYIGLTGEMAIEWSHDGGTTWEHVCSTPFNGAEFVRPRGGGIGTQLPNLACSFPQDVGLKARARLILSQSVSLGFTVTIFS